MRKLYSLFLILSLITGLRAQDSNAVYLIFDDPCSDSLPPAFRKMNDVFHRLWVNMPSVYGLASLNASGSAQYCPLNLPAVIKEIGFNKITIVDLRQESHGIVNGRAVSWFGKYNQGNIGLSRDQVEENEEDRLDSLRKAGIITVARVFKKDKATHNIIESEVETLQVKDVDDEEQFTETLRLDYFRITVTDHRMPAISDVDRFVKFARNRRDTWLHFHGSAGEGRTTTFLAMYDMMRNAKKVSLDDIISRQYLLGGINLASDEDFPEGDESYAAGRTKFLKSFYDYSKYIPDEFITLYSEWLKK